MNNTPLVFSVLALIASTTSANDLALPGFTGSIRTPNANIATPGKIYYQYNNANDANSSLDNTYNHVFAVGINSHIEVGGRLTDWYNNNRVTNVGGTLPGKRDLSGNLKFRLPRMNNYLPDIAIGIQDFGGEAVNFRSTYGVMSKTISKATLSVGHAKNDSLSNLNGHFGSLDIQVSPAVKFKADYADKTFAFGVGIDTQKITKIPLSVQVAAEEQNDGKWNELVGVTLTLPLDKKFGKAASKNKQLKLTSQERNTTQFIQALEAQGLVHTRLGTLNNVDVVFIENNIYNHSYLDALSVVLGNAYKYLGGKKSVQIALSKQNQPLLVVQVNMHEYGKFINGKTSNIKTTTKSWFPAKGSFNKVTWLATSKHAKRSPINIRIQPEVRSNLGSEWGVFDYSAALRADIKIPLGKIADVVVSGSVPVVNSDLYDDGAAFANRRHESKINHAVVQKLIKPSPATTVLASAGYSTVNDEEFVLGQLEGAHNLSNGNRQLFAKATYFKNNNAGDDHYIAAGGIKQHLNFLNMDAEVSYGQYYDETRGVKAKVSKFFDDTELSAEIKYVNTDDLSGRLSISLPLTPRKDKIIGNTVVRGSKSWNYAVETTIKDPIIVGSNRARPNYMLDPELSYTLEKDYLDKDRLSPSHFMDNIDQLKQRSIGLISNN